MRTIKSKIKKAINDCDILIKEYKQSDGSKKYDDAMKRISKTNKYIEEQDIYSIIDDYVVTLAANEMSHIYRLTESVDENNLNTYKQSKAIYEAVKEAVDYVYPKLEGTISKL